jgi:4-hydroxybenzoyl-CoA thioesterase/acyl-CoA thioester hydrolase
MPAAFVTSRRVEFCDTDASGMMHFAAFFRLMEQAEHDLLRSVGLSVVSHDGAGTISWPRVAAKCEFKSPARFDEVIQVEVRIVRLGKRSITYGHRLLRDGQELATGEITAVCCRFREGSATGGMESMLIPDWFAEKVRALDEP